MERESKQEVAPEAREDYRGNKSVRRSVELGLLSLALTAISYMIINKYIAPVTIWQYLIMETIFLLSYKLISYMKRSK